MDQETHLAVPRQGPGVVREYILRTLGTNEHTVSFYALPQFLSVATHGVPVQEVVARYATCPRLTIRRVRPPLLLGGRWLVER